MLKTFLEFDLSQDGRITAIVAASDSADDRLFNAVGDSLLATDLWTLAPAAASRIRRALSDQQLTSLKDVRAMSHCPGKAPFEISFRFEQRLGRERSPEGYRCFAMVVPADDNAAILPANSLLSILETVLNSSSECIKVLDTQGRLISMNAPGLCAMEVDDFTRIRHQIWHELWPTEDQSAARNAFDKAMQGQVARFEGYCPTVKGTPKWWEVVVAPVHGVNGQPEVLVTLSRDLTRLHRQRNLATETESRFLALADNMAQLAWMASPNGYIFWYNKRWLEYTGTTLESMQGWGWKAVHHPDHIDRVVKKISLAFERQTDWEDTFPLRGADGNYRWFLSRMMAIRDEAGRVQLWLGTNTDITEQQKVEDSLRRSEQKLMLGIAVGGLGIAEIRYSSGQVRLNPTAAAIFGLPNGTDRMSRDAMHASFHPDDRVDMEHEIQRQLKQEHETYFQRECRIVRPSGEVRWLSTRKHFFFEETGHERPRPSHALMAVRDITEEKERELHLRQAQIQADAANRAKSNFLANMSHEIRSPMTAILGYTELLKAQDEDQHAVVDTIRRNGRFLLQLVNDILDLSRIESGRLDIDRVAFDPAELVRDVCSLMSLRAAEKGLNLTADISPGLSPKILSDPIRLRQILINLVGNAIKFTDLGHVKIRLIRNAANDELHFAVTDTGCGIPANKLDRLFQPFEQLDTSHARRHEGSGLGLAISRRLTQMLGGRLDVVSVPNQGSTFSLSLPAEAPNDGFAHSTATENAHTEAAPDVVDRDNRSTVTDEANAVVPAVTQPSNTQDYGSRSVPTEPPRINIRVLVVDDRRDILFLTSAFVRKVGGDVIAATSAAEAMDIIRHRQAGEQQIELVLMDIQMPEMDGITATRHLRSSGVDIPIIALTANAMDDDRMACLEAGFTDYLSKPIDFQRLVSVMQKYAVR